MNILAFDTALGTSSLALSVGGDIIAALSDDVPNNQAAQLIPHIDALMREAGMKWDELDLIACTTGPGGFTSVRIGVAAARGLGFSANVPVHGVSLPALMAYHYVKTNPQATQWRCLIPAGRKDAAAQIFTNNAGKERAVSDIELIAREPIPDDMPHCITGNITDESAAYYDCAMAAHTLCDMLHASPPQPVIAPSPLYARPPDAAISKPFLKGSAP